MRFIVWIALLLSYMYSGAVWAHDLGVAKVLFEKKASERYLLRAKLPATLDVAPPVLPQRCTIIDTARRSPNGLDQIIDWNFHCTQPSSTTEDGIVLPWNREGALVTVSDKTGRRSVSYLEARGGDVHFSIAELMEVQVSRIETARRYLILGVEHILFGIDHLAFVLMLFLLASGSRLVKLVTAFTVGHSLTLALAVMGWIKVPTSPVEVCIALSIVFVARQALLSESKFQHGFWLVVGFGLLHGLGFASALGEVGLSGGHMVLGLFTFNLGVEIGQLAFLVLVFLLGKAFSSIDFHPIWAKGAIAFGIGSVAMFWSFERLIKFVA